MLQEALAVGGPDLIPLCPRTTHQGTFTIARPVTVGGVGANSSLLDRAGSGQVVTITNLVPDPVSLERLGINGDAAFLGGGVKAVGALHLTRCRIVNNVASQGGGVATRRALTLVDSVVTVNRCELWGGGIFATRSQASVVLRRSSLVAQNEVMGTSEPSTGGGIHASSVSVDLNDASQIAANTAMTESGGILVASESRLELHDRGSITGNAALGGVDSGGGNCMVQIETEVELLDQAMVSGNTPDQWYLPIGTPTGTCT